MKIYVAHPSIINYREEIYTPLRQDNFFLQHSLILPHEEDVNFQDVRGRYKDIDIVISECSQPSTGMGIELGWFFDDKKPIFCLYKKGTMPSSALKAITKAIIEYENSEDFVIKVKEIIAQFAPNKN